MKKILLLATVLAFAATSTVAFAATDPAPATKKVCHIKKGKEVCKEIKVKPKSDPLKKPAVKKPITKKKPKKKA